MPGVSGADSEVGRGATHGEVRHMIFTPPAFEGHLQRPSHWDGGGIKM